jgi:putative membrane protein
MMWGPWNGGWWGFGMGLGMLLFLALIVFGIVLLLRPTVGPEPRREHDRALEILNERFARGEIDREEYEERRRVLESGRS